MKQKEEVKKLLSEAEDAIVGALKKNFSPYWKRKIPMMVTNKTGTCVFGLFRTKIFIPLGLLQKAKEEGFPDWYSAMMLHEIAHIERQHYIILVVMKLLCALYWFHPVVWLMYRYLREDMEYICDARAIRAMQGDNVGYVNAMLDYVKLQNIYPKETKVVTEIPYISRSGSMKERVKKILSQKRCRIWCSVITASVATGIIVLTAMLLTQKEKPPVQDEIQNETPSPTWIDITNKYNKEDWEYVFTEEEIEKAVERVKEYYTAIKTGDLNSLLSIIHERVGDLPPYRSKQEYAQGLLSNEEKHTIERCEYTGQKISSSQSKNVVYHLDVHPKNVIYLYAYFSVEPTELGTGGYQTGANFMGVFLLREDENSDWFVIGVGF